MKPLLLSLALASLSFGALTPEQKDLDFRILAAHYAKLYAPYEWKLEIFGFDLMNIQPWLARVRATTNDLEYYEVCSEYVASLKDGHSNYFFPSSFSFSAPLHVDIYDNKFIIDSISRSALPLARFPFVTGDELVSYNGKPVEDTVAQVERTVSFANDYARRRIATQRLFFASQQSFPRAHEIGDTVEITVRRRATGELENYTIPITKSGVPLETHSGILPTPAFREAPAPVRDDYSPAWVTALADLQNMVAEFPERAVLGFGPLAPGFPLPAGFQQRLGTSVASHAFYSGTFMANGLRIGFIRIPTMSPTQGTTAALRQFETEMAFFNQNTDGLVVDIMRNGGGSACYTEELERRLILYPFDSVGFELRSTIRYVNSFKSAVDIAKAQNAEPYIISLLQSRFEQAEQAYKENRGRTGPISLCGGTFGLLPHPVAYTKPILMLIDEFSASAGDIFAAVLQDAGRAKLMGVPTSGLGGSVESRPLGPYSEAQARHTISLVVRPKAVTVPGYPTTRYVENVGVHPDIPWNYMNIDNLLSGYRNYTFAVTDEIVNLIRNPQ